MKLSGRDARAYLAKPDPSHAGILIFGADGAQVAMRRRDVVAQLAGPEAEAEMRLTRLDAGELRKDGAALQDGLKAQGFFPGHRIVVTEDLTDGLSKLVAAALAAWQPGDAQIVATAGQLTAKSALRKVFESHPRAVAIGLYDDPPGRDEIEAQLQAAGLPAPSRESMDALTALAQSIAPSDFRQAVEKLGLYKRGDNSPLTPEDIDAVAPQTADVDIDDIIAVVADGSVGQIGPTLRGLYDQGVMPVALCIGAMRHFRRLHQAASDPGGPASGIGKLRPPVFGPRRDRMARQASAWGRDRLERALGVLTDTDLELRSARRAPDRAVMERALIRLAMMARR